MPIYVGVVGRVLNEHWTCAISSKLTGCTLSNINLLQWSSDGRTGASETTSRRFVRALYMSASTLILAQSPAITFCMQINAKLDKEQNDPCLCGWRQRKWDWGGGGGGLSNCPPFVTWWIENWLKVEILLLVYDHFGNKQLFGQKTVFCNNARSLSRTEFEEPHSPAEGLVAQRQWEAAAQELAEEARGLQGARLWGPPGPSFGAFTQS